MFAKPCVRRTSVLPNGRQALNSESKSAVQKAEQGKLNVKLDQTVCGFYVTVSWSVLEDEQ